LLREPHEAAATRFFSEVERGNITAYLCAASFSTIYYLLRKELGRPRADELVRAVRALIEIAPVDATVIDQAIALGWDDFEDAIIHEAARLASLDAVVTRNPRDFRRGILPAVGPDEVVAMVRRSSVVLHSVWNLSGCWRG
jgi:predicted nucleic acid-binding protein